MSKFRSCWIITISLVFEILTNYYVVCLTIPHYYYYEELPHEKEMYFRVFAVNLKNSLNFEVNPCVDYFEYVCSNFDENRKIRSRVIKGHDLKELLGKYTPKMEAEKKMISFFQSCNRAHEKQHSLREFFENYTFSIPIYNNNRWPIMETSWNESKFDLESILAEFQSYGIPNLLHLDVKRNEFVLSSRVTKFKDDEEEEIVKSLFSAIRVDLDSVHEVINNTKFILKKSTEALSNTENQYIEITMTFKELKEKVNEFNWDKYFLKLLGEKISEKQLIKIQNPDGLFELLTTLQEIQPKMIANYLFYQIINEIRINMDDEDFCYMQILEYFKEIIYRIIIDKFYTDDFKIKFFNITRTILEATKLVLNVSIATDDILNKGLVNFDTKFYPSLSDATLHKKYVNIKIDPEHYYKNLFELRRSKLIKIQQASSSSTELDASKEDDDESSIIDYETISDVFSSALYFSQNKPMAVVFDLISSPIILSTMSLIDLPKYHEMTLIDCLQRQQIEDVDQYLRNLKSGAVYMKSFNDWIEQNRKLYDIENEIFKEYGLSTKQVLFISLAESACDLRAKDFTQNELSKFIFNLKDFSEEYNCPIGAPMNPKQKCDLISFVK